MKKRSFIRIWERGNELLGLGGGFIILGMMLIIFYEVVMRYLFNRPTIWVTETSELLLVIIAFLVLSYTLQTDGHVAVTIVKERVSERVRLYMQLATSVVALLFGGVLTWFGLVVALEDLESSAISSMSLPIPLFPIKIFIPFGGLLFCISLLIRIWTSAAAIASARAKETPGKAVKIDPE